MKKASLIACACALFMGAQSMAAQSVVEQVVVQEVTYVEDYGQGTMLNRMKDNWFIQLEAGASFYLAPNAIHRCHWDRFMPAGSLYAGKWFSPVFGGRFGIDLLGLKGLTVGADQPGAYSHFRGDYYKAKYFEFGPVFDLMINLTNWWCGYKPNRVYNATVYVGAGGYFTFVPYYTASGTRKGFSHIEDDQMTLRAGLLNSFRLNKHLDLNIDLRFSGIGCLQNEPSKRWNDKTGAIQAYLGLTYNFNKVGWSAPVIPVCPEPENCDALRARLAAADARIDELEAQLKACLARPTQTVVEAPAGPLATVYYPIGVSTLSRENRRVVTAIANVMNQNDKKYVVTGWADNYTGTDNINMRLRKQRAEGVQKVLVKNGVAADRLTVTTNNGNLNDLGEKCVALDRAVTIEEAK